MNMGTRTKKSKTAIWFTIGLLLGAAMVWVILNAGILPNKPKKGQTDSVQKAQTNTCEMTNLSELRNVPVYVLDSAMFRIDSLFYLKSWNHLIEMPGYREMDSLFLDSIIRKMYFDSLTGFQKEPTDTFVVQNDRLLETRSVKVVVQKSLFGKNDTAKTDDYVYSEARYKIEFWESPIHYKGYKRSGTYVIVYGFDPDNILAWAQIDNQLYMKERQWWHPLPVTDEFDDFSNVTAPKLLTRLELALKRI